MTESTNQNRHVKCQCTHCACVFRLTRVWIQRAEGKQGLRCPTCGSPAVEGEVMMTDEERDDMYRRVDAIAAKAAEELNAEELARREEELWSRRVHINRRKYGVNTPKENP